MAAWSRLSCDLCNEHFSANTTSPNEPALAAPAQVWLLLLGLSFTWSRWSWEIIWKLKSQVSPFDPDFGNGNAFFPDVDTTEDMFPAQGLVKS